MNEPQTQQPASPSPSPGSASPPHQAKFNFWKWFWLSVLVVSLGWAWHDFYVPANNIAWARDYASAQQQASQSGKPIILFFTANWCVPCRIMKRNVWADDEVKTSVNEKFVPVMIDRDDPHAAAELTRYQIGATPTTVITDPNGTVLQQVQGGLSKADFLALLEKSSPPTAPAGGTAK